MRYRTDSTYDRSRANESRADQIEHALTVATDKSAEEDSADVYTDVSDLLASMRHFCDRAGIDYDDVDAHAQTAYEGDVAEDEGGPAARDTDRFPKED